MPINHLQLAGGTRTRRGTFAELNGVHRHVLSVFLDNNWMRLKPAANILPPAIRDFRKQRPDVRIQLFDADLPTLIQMVETGKLDMSLGIFKAMPDVRREPFFRFSLMVARAAKDDIQPRRTTTWSILDGETLISLSPGHPHQQLIDKHLAQAGVKVQIESIVNLLDTQIALVEAEEGPRPLIMPLADGVFEASYLDTAPQRRRICSL
jgi:DNA-binding transcriptional LysR family regulator